MTKLPYYPDPEKIKYPDNLPRDVHLNEQEYFVILGEYFDVNRPIKGSGFHGQWMGKVLIAKFLKKRLKERNVSVEGYTF